MAASLIRREAARIRTIRRSAVKGVKPTARSTGVTVRKRRTSKLRIRG